MKRRLFLRNLLANRSNRVIDLSYGVKLWSCFSSTSVPPLPPPTQKEKKGKPKGFRIPIYNPYSPGGFASGHPDFSKPYITLGIESSCDDTGVSIVRSDGKVLSNVVIHQYDVHARFGGIVPTLAMEAHKSNINLALERAFRESGLKDMSEIDVVSATKGPGLSMCLRVGYSAGIRLAKQLCKPFVAVNHLEAHITLSRLLGESKIISGGVNGSISSDNTSNHSIKINGNSNNNPFFLPKINYPFLALLVSGGHTLLCICHGVGNYEMLGGTLDDSVGECFDKAARLLGLPMNSSGGAAIEKCAQLGNPSTYPMPVPMVGIQSCDFSYAGLKNSFRLHLEKERKNNNYTDNFNSKNAPLFGLEEVKEIIRLPDEVTANLCASFQNAAFLHLIDRFKRALSYIRFKNIPITAVTISGGVAANKDLTRRISELLALHGGGLDLVIPPPSVCTDNGLMVAWNAVEKLSIGISDSSERDDDVIPRWPLAEFVDIDFKSSSANRSRI